MGFVELSILVRLRYSQCLLKSKSYMGVSATHLDWTMIPYVRKSFFKHFLVSYLKDRPDFINLNLLELALETYTDSVGIERNKFDDWVDKNKNKCLDELGLKEEDFYLGNEKLEKKYYQSALYDVIVEVKQAVEGMYHNLNTLQSRSGESY